MTEYWVRLEVYLRHATLDAATEKAVDALSGIADGVLVVDGGLMKEAS